MDNTKPNRNYFFSKIFWIVLTAAIGILASIVTSKLTNQQAKVCFQYGFESYTVIDKLRAPRIDIKNIGGVPINSFIVRFEIGVDKSAVESPISDVELDSHDS